MSNSTSYPCQGEVYLSRALRQGGDTKKRPVVVVSIDARNRYSSTVLVIPFSSDIEGAGGNPSRVQVPVGEGGLELDSIALCDLITNVERRYLERGSYGRVSDRSLQRIQAGILVAIGLYEV